MNIGKHFDNFPYLPLRSGVWVDFFSDEDIAQFVFTATASGTFAVLDTTRHGVGRITGLATTDDCGGEAQVDAASYALELGKTLRFLCRFKLDETTSTDVDLQSDLIIGLATLDTSLIASAPTNGIYINKVDGSALVDCYARASGANVGTAAGAATLVRGTWYTLAIEIAMDSATANKGTVTFYIDGTSITTITVSGLPTGLMTPSFAFQSGNNLGTKFLDVDFIGAEMVR